LESCSHKARLVTYKIQNKNTTKILIYVKAQIGLHLDNISEKYTYITTTAPKMYYI